MIKKDKYKNRILRKLYKELKAKSNCHEPSMVPKILTNIEKYTTNLIQREKMELDEINNCIRKFEEDEARLRKDQQRKISL